MKGCMATNNQHIENFLEYYYKLSTPPEYAILIKGKWGAGKTWFIQQSLKKLKERGGKYLYVSLYGVNNLDQIENEFFRQLHPLLSSKGVTLAGKLLKGLLKTTIKFDIDSDGKDDGTVIKHSGYKALRLSK
jgi:Cdc6-like AAA superfamily ATPase